MKDACARQLSTAKSDADSTEANELSGLLCLSGAGNVVFLQISSKQTVGHRLLHTST